MKPATIIFLLFFTQYQLSFSQLHDSVSIFHRQVKKQQLIGIRKISQANYLNYKINEDYFGCNMKGDSLYIYIKGKVDCLPQTVFVGEYTTADSIHFVDFMLSEGIKPPIQIENICGYTISRNQLPGLKRLVFNAGAGSVTIVSATMYIQTDTSVVSFTLDESGVFSDEIKQYLLKMQEGKVIVFDNIRVLVKEDGLMRTIQNPPGYMIKD